MSLPIFKVSTFLLQYFVFTVSHYVSFDRSLNPLPLFLIEFQMEEFQVYLELDRSQQHDFLYPLLFGSIFMYLLMIMV